jgi:uncharacterized protein (TIGR03083 family)
VDYARFVDEITEQAAALRAAAASAGPAAPTPTCPKWTVFDLVRHLGRVHQWSGRALTTDPEGESPHPDEPPSAWDELLPWWDTQLGTLVDILRRRQPETPAWVFDSRSPHTAGFWARRQAHETAIHRLDAEHAAAGSDQPDSVPTLVFDPEFAADGIDEALTFLIPRQLDRAPAAVHGTVLLHAADAGRSWLVEVGPDQPLKIDSSDPALDADATVAGTADSVYRAIWKRPSSASIGGDPILLAALRMP